MSSPLEHAQRLRTFRAGRFGDDLHLVVFGQVGHHDVEQEAIELRFGQRIGAFELDRVLRGQHEERPLERIGPAGGGDVILLHRLEQRRLRLRRRAVDLVGENDLREDRPLHETQRAGAVILVEDLRAGDVGRHQVGRELDALEAQVENLRQRLDQQRLREAGHAGDQAVAAAKQRHQHLVDDVVLADDDLAEFGEDFLAAGSDLFGQPLNRHACRVLHHSSYRGRL